MVDFLKDRNFFAYPRLSVYIMADRLLDFVDKLAPIILAFVAVKTSQPLAFWVAVDNFDGLSSVPE